MYKQTNKHNYLKVVNQGLFQTKTRSDIWMLPLMIFFSFKNLFYQKNCTEAMFQGKTAKKLKLILQDLVKFFFDSFSQKQPSRSLNTKKPLKWMLLNEKQNICSLHGAVTFQNILWVILWTLILHTIFFAVKESCHGNLVIDCWLSNKWNNVRLLLVESLVIIIFM